jgi:hypothetical protein
MSDDMMREPIASDAPSPECEALVDARLADYLDESPDPALVAAVDAHVAGCARCAALVGDLTGITAAARALPPLQPSRDLWAGVAERIAEPTVVSIDAARGARRRVALPARWRSLGAAAAALVLVTAGVTYTVTKVTMGAGADVTASADANRPKGSVVNGPPAPKGELALRGDTTSAARGDSIESPAGATTPASDAPFRVARNEKRGAAAAATKSTYDREIGDLRRIVRERRSQLDPATLDVLERNIAIIDAAIAQSRAALAHDPRSRFLDDQLNNALDKKLELLRTAALLPART